MTDKNAAWNVGSTSEGITVGDMKGAICAIPAHWPHGEKAKENARLIAAAPDLLAALEEALDSARLAAIHETPGPNVEFCPWFAQGLAAIAKARAAV